jgi:predicted PurR-regulated permease PerM
MKIKNKYVSFGLMAFILYMIYLYWRPFVKLIGTFVKAASPMIFGLVLAYIVNIIMIRYEALYKKLFLGKGEKVRRGICILLSFVSVIAFFAIMTAIIAPQIVNAIATLIKNGASSLTPYIKKLSKYPQAAEVLKNVQNYLKPSSGSISKQATQLLKQVFTGNSNLFKQVTSILSSIVSILATILFGFIFSIYLLGGKERLQDQLCRLIKAYIPKTYGGIMYVAHVFNHAFSNFIICKVTDGIILGVLTTLGALILRIPYAFMVGPIIGITALVPIIGAYIGALVSAFLIFTVKPASVIVFLIYYIILQQVDDNVIYPRIVGSSLGLPAIWTLASVTVFGSVFGLAGMILGVPVTSALYTMISENVHQREAKALAMKEDE